MYIEKTHTENIEYFRKYIVERSNTPKENTETVFKKWHDQVTNTEMSAEMLRYHNETKNPGFFTGSSKKEKQLEDALINLYRINYTKVTNAEFAKTLTQSVDFRKYIANIEAKNLLSGTSIYSGEVAALEAKQMRESLQSVTNELTETKSSLTKLTFKFNNIVSHLKHTFGVADDKILEYSSKAAEKIEANEAKPAQKNTLKI
jgi:hypothetical protein